MQQCDFLTQLLHPDLKVIQECKTALEAWLQGIGLELHPSKTKITHTLEAHEGAIGFDFLGFQVQQYPMGKYRTGKGTNGKPLGFKTLITPSKEKVKTHQRKLGEIVQRHKAAPQEALIAKLNPIITGWARYYSAAVSKKVFSAVDHILYLQLRSWAYSRHPRKNRYWICDKYWLVASEGWVFATKNKQCRLNAHVKMPIRRHVKVQGNRSPYDGDWVYWATRSGNHPDTTRTTASLLKKQRGICPWCNLYFKDGDLLENDHIVPKALKGSDTRENRQLLHRHCHDEKTSQDGSSRLARNDNTPST